MILQGTSTVYRRQLIASLVGLAGIIGLLWLSSLSSPAAASAGDAVSYSEWPQVQVAESYEEPFVSGHMELPTLENGTRSYGEQPGEGRGFLVSPTYY